ncbi:hypothetical protein FIBSPDRAFT_1053285 [Athelia psychrophila]|uniref:Uncharacterized protein n=1 Tax=Athelia psychrophila TaxID=1759441 RepID=A0A167X6J1_9AGAM|nr:hypothetical protein FIBSPDRAFT_1053285 [Fibularhizoctonia sp. CBS 109695]
MSSGFTTVELKPNLGFVVKSSTTTPFVLRRSSTSEPRTSNLLEPVDPPPAGPPSLSPQAPKSSSTSHGTCTSPAPSWPEEGGYYVPVALSPPPKALVFDAVFHTSLKGRATRNEALKASVIGTPNLASKGALAPRRVQIPSALFAAASSAASDAPDVPDALNITGTGIGTAGKAKGKKLIEEVEVEVPPNSKRELKGEAKNGSAKAKAKTNVKGILKPAPAPAKDAGPTTPRWSWAKAGTRIKITIAVPLLTHAHIPSATLDLEPRRILLAVPGLYALDVPLDAPDAELVAASAQLDSDGTTAAAAGGGGWETGALGLKRARDLDVEGARAEWRVEEGCLVVLRNEITPYSRAAYTLHSVCTPHQISAIRALCIGYMVHTIPTATTPGTALTTTVSTVAGTLNCCETGPSHPAGSASAMDAAGRVMLDGDARLLRCTLCGAESGSVWMATRGYHQHMRCPKYCITCW